MVIGGQAVLLHGEPRLTKDIDLTLAAGLDRRFVLDMLRQFDEALSRGDELTRRFAEVCERPESNS